MKRPRSVQVIVFRQTPEGREYLLLLRRLPGHPDFWQPVSGSLEEGEDEFAAARREVLEETGLEPRGLRSLNLVNRFPIAQAWLDRYPSGTTHNVQVSLAARVDSDAVRTDDREHVAYAWERYDRAREMLHYEPNRRALDLVEGHREGAARRVFELPLGRRVLTLGERTLVMGILNVTPDSFSDGGEFFDLERAVDRALEIEAYGADILDIGGESSRPGAGRVSESDELRRVVPVVEALAGRLSIPISVDTTRGETARAALDAGAEILNDISALRFDPGLGRAAAQAGAGLVLMHMRGTPETMQTMAPSEEILLEMERDLLEAIDRSLDEGVALERIVLDPGIGFGKTLDQNVEILARLDRIAALDRPVLVGTSRKSFLGRLTGRDTNERLAASIASATAAVLAGAHIVRVHDVAETVDAVRVADAVVDSGMRAT